ncbi:PH domain-containing protein [Nannizzia gypsea CBS 118893]|uniref:PH domain-containing protein n=1 Tax=Arthroderma gypseum (strain ATCC MYA-4604 / CBS 118893) TaxID=535722 RepID=E4V0P4_ARTGP|nr:PH domain-containing protein [Nannizzia gypsea CBS 118893]EFR03181.1 PH domain-containing protein [Nannizzia gypsea CBS 118893]
MALQLQLPAAEDRSTAMDAIAADGHTERPGVRRSQVLDAFSPVNENGSFEFDRVLKRGKVLRRSKSKHAFKSSWKPGYLVLRPNLLSLYKDKEEAQLQLAISLSDVSAVAHVKSTPKSNRPNVFGVFSPSKNYRFQATSAEEAESWVEQLHRECSVDYPDSVVNYYEQIHGRKQTVAEAEESAAEMSEIEGRGGTAAPGQVHSLLKAPVQPDRLKRRTTQDYSGNEITSCSEFSDAAGQSLPSAGPHPAFNRKSFSRSTHRDQPQPLPQPQQQQQQNLRRLASGQSEAAPSQPDPEGVIFQGYLQCLKGRKGVRKWKKLWTVLRVQSLSFYKDQHEYSAVKIIPMTEVINAAEVDPLSRSKIFCFQLITEDITYRFCAYDEESVDKWLGSVKSVLMRLQDSSIYHSAGTLSGSLNTR